jgi:hypothetical protein
MLQLVLATLITAESRAVTFDEAKADASKRMGYIGGLLDKHVFDKDKNPKGTIQAWYFVADKDQRAAAEAAIKARYEKDGRAFYFAKEVAAIFAPLDSAVRRAIPWYSDMVAAGSGTHSGILLVGDLFSLGGEDEVKSVVEDYVLGLVQMRENGLKVKDLELDANIPALKLVSNKSLLPLYAQAGQLESILKGSRKVSEGFKKELTHQYLATHAVFGKMYAHERKVFDDNNENTLQKEIVDFLEECFKFGHERFEKLGYKHTLVNKENHEWTLEKK